MMDGSHRVRDIRDFRLLNRQDGITKEGLQPHRVGFPAVLPATPPQAYHIDKICILREERPDAVRVLSVPGDSKAHGDMLGKRREKGA
jgi:hypothetical protein